MSRFPLGWISGNISPGMHQKRIEASARLPQALNCVAPSFLQRAKVGSDVSDFKPMCSPPHPGAITSISHSAGPGVDLFWVSSENHRDSCREGHFKLTEHYMRLVFAALFAVQLSGPVPAADPPPEQ